jgi:hypothetical protein
MESTRACQEASTMFSETPMVPQCSDLSADSMITRTVLKLYHRIYFEFFFAAAVAVSYFSMIFSISNPRGF